MIGTISSSNQRCLIDIARIGGKPFSILTGCWATIVIGNSFKTLTGAIEIIFNNPITFTLAASGASEQTMKDARVLLRQMTSRRKNREPIPSGESLEPAEKGRPFSQRGFESMTNHFAQLVQLISNEPLYQPTEYHLSVTGLIEHVSKLRSHNTTVKEARVTLSHSRLALYQIYYGDVNSVVVAARSAKKYIRAIFGLYSSQYRQVKKFNFAKTKIR